MRDYRLPEIRKQDTAWTGTLALRPVFSRPAIDAIMKGTILRYHTPQ
jgi:hypothetical protein